MEDRAEQDPLLAERVLQGDTQAFSELMERYQRLVASVAWRYGVPQQEIEDVVSEVFIKTFSNLDRYRPEHAFSTWFYRLAAPVVSLLYELNFVLSGLSRKIVWKDVVYTMNSPDDTRVEFRGGN